MNNGEGEVSWERRMWVGEEWIEEGERPDKGKGVEVRVE